VFHGGKPVPFGNQAPSWRPITRESKMATLLRIPVFFDHPNRLRAGFIFRET